MRLAALRGALLAFAVATTALVGTGGAASPAIAQPASAGACTPGNPDLAPSPVPSPTSGIVLPVRDDPDGSVTLTSAVEDPVDPTGGDYFYTSASPVGAGDPDAGVFYHPWPTAPQVVTFGVYSVVNGQRVRVPVLLTENLPLNWIEAIVELIDQEVSPITANSTPFLLDTVDPSEVLWNSAVALVGSESGASAPDHFSNFNEYPANIGYQDLAPIYLWSTYRSAPGEQLWQGLVVTHDGTYATNALGQHLACWEGRIGEVARTNSGTTFLGGLFVSETAQSTDTLSSPGSYGANETITTGTTTEAGGTWTDVAIAEVQQSEAKSGQVQYVYGPDAQTDTIALGLDLGGSFVPLVGTQANTTNGVPPNAEDRVISLGVYNPVGTYVPIIGVHTHFTNMPAGQWLAQWPSGSGPGAEGYGDWQIDLGTFDPLGNFVPLLGVRYNEKLPNAMYPYQMYITAGPWVAAGEVGELGGPSLMGDTYMPVIGVSYDGQEPLEQWELADVDNNFASMGSWLAAVGVISPRGNYVPLVGASYSQGSTTSASPVVEDYHVGSFSGAYPDFVPVVGARWSSSDTSLGWAQQYAINGALVPATATVNVGPTTPSGTFVASTQITAAPGNPDTYGVGLWAQSMFVPLLTVAAPGDGLFCALSGQGSSSGSTTAFGGASDPANTSGTFSFTATPTSVACQAFVRRNLYEVTTPFTVSGSYRSARDGVGWAVGSLIAYAQSGELPTGGTVPAQIDCNFSVSFGGSVSDAAANPPETTTQNNGVMLGDCQVYVYSSSLSGGWVEPAIPTLANVMIGGYLNVNPTDQSGDFQVAGAFGGAGGVPDQYPFLVNAGYPPF